MKRVGQVNLDTQLWQVLESIAKAQEVSVSKVVRDIIKRDKEVQKELAKLKGEVK